MWAAALKCEYWERQRPGPEGDVRLRLAAILSVYGEDLAPVTEGGALLAERQLASLRLHLRTSQLRCLAAS